MYHCAWLTLLPEVTWPWVTWHRRGSLRRLRECATRSCAIFALEGLFHRKWRRRTSPVRLPLELEVTRSEVPLGCSLGRPHPKVACLLEVYLSLVICPFPAILFSRGAPSIITFLTTVCCFRICSRCCVVLQVVYEVRILTVVFLLNNLRVKSLLA